MTRRDIPDLVRRYLDVNPEESVSLGRLSRLISIKPTDSQLIDMNSFDGHVTSSAIIISRRTIQILKLHNVSIGIPLQPGGHIRDGLTPRQNAERVLEEFGIYHEVTFIPSKHGAEIPLDIDTHEVPGNPERDEPSHLHHDFRYLYVCEDKFDCETPYGKPIWQSVSELKKSGTFIDLIEKLQLLWSKEYEEEKFYAAISDRVKLDEQVTFIAVQHFLPGVDHFLKSLERLGKVGAVIPKPKSMDKTIVTRVSKHFNVIQFPDREAFDTSIKRVTDIIEESDKVVLIDIGGWFAPFMDDWESRFPIRILGVVEDTENGHQKYQEIARLRKDKAFPFPVYSVARSPLKMNEDTLIGQSIVFSADSILRNSQNKLIKYMTCGVIGYGKVGRSIASDLLGESIRPVVFDKDPLKLIEAYNDGCSICGSTHALIADSDVIFCATGNKSLRTDDLAHIKRGSYLLSVTSADDEFDFVNLNTKYRKEDAGTYVERFFRFENSFYLVNKGNAANFIHKAVVGDFIHLVKAEILIALGYLASNRGRKTIGEVSDKDRKAIAREWLRCFQDFD